MKLPIPAYQSVVLSKLPIHTDFLPVIRKKECLFVYKDKAVVQKHVESPEINVNREPEVEERSLQEQMDMAGTPLECPFDLNVLKIEDEDFYSKESMDSHHKSELKSCLYKPFSSFEARGILSNFILDTSLQSSLPVFCLCDAEDGTSILGIEKGKNNELTQYKITVAGPIPPTHANIQFDHLKSEMTFMTEVGEFSTRAFAVYEAYRGIHLNNGESNGNEAFVRLECSWMKPTKILEFPHIASQAKVIVHPLPGETSSGAYEIWRQLNTLQHLIKGLESLEIVWFVKKSQKTLREEIDKLISAFCKDETDQLKGKIEYDELYDEQQLIYKRTPMDFIDHLWELLSQNCSSFNDLSQSLQYTLQRAKSDHPMVFFDNPTRFGKMLRQNDALPQFTGMEPVSLLIEMGIEKLKRDYLYIFSGNNLVAERVISMFLPQDGTPFSDQLNCLTSIQSAVEVVSLCHRVLQLPHLALRDVITPLLEHYRNPDNLGKEFSFQLGVCLLKGFFQHQESGSSVEKWRVEFTSTTDCHPVKLACQLTANNLLDASSTGDEEAVGERLYSVERYLTKTQQLL
uniref:Protein zwilch n=1 Tax=Daphnia galeata TaxID=27404 RepID=A0A8J2SBW8_9CRUS|nr:unnamed protein product [Daphnia galeata]